MPRTTCELVSKGDRMFSKKNIITPWNSNRLPLQSKREQPRTAWPLWGLLGDKAAFIYLLALGCVRESVIPNLKNFAQTPNHRHKTSVCLQTSAINSSKGFSLLAKCCGFCSCSLGVANLPGWQHAEKALSACLCDCWGEHRLCTCLLMGFLWCQGPHKAGTTQNPALWMQQSMMWCIFTYP